MPEIALGPEQIVVGAGTYTEITEIVAPSSAIAGSRVDITVKIKNKYSSTIGIMVGGALEYGVSPWPTITFPTYQANVAAGATHSFFGYFTMPNKKVTIHAYSYYYAGGGWYFDDEKTKTVNLGEVFAGTISKKQLEYDSSIATIPASDIPQNKRGLVHIWGRNDMSSTQRLGIWWQVKNPAGTIVETYGYWEAYPYTSAGGTHEFIGGRFTLSSVGTYTIDVVLYMNPDDPTIVDRYTGKLCTATAQYPAADIRNLAVVIKAVEYPAADIRNIQVVIIAPEYPAADIKDIQVVIIGEEYPAADIKDIEVTISGGLPPGAELFQNLVVTYKKP